MISRARVLRLLVIAIIGVVIFLVITRTFLASPFEIEGSAMADTLTNGQYVIVAKYPYLIGDPQRGDIAVFHPPSDPSKYYLKRIIGLPGETVLIRHGNVYVQRGSEEVRLHEPYLNAKNQGKTFERPIGGDERLEVRFDVPAGHYFVLGDNRQGSIDSRSFVKPDGTLVPYVSRDAMVGKTWFIALPLPDIRALPDEPYPELE